MRYRIDYDKKRMKKVEKLLIVCFCKSLVDFFVIRYNIEETKTEEERGGDGMDSFTKKILKAIIIYVILVVIFIVLFQTVFMLSFVPSSSMEGTIKTNSVVFSTMYDVDEEDLERYDILTFITPDDPDVTYIKRLIGLPGETIEVKEGKVYADGVELDDSFIKDSQNRVGDGIYTVPEGYYFFLGDNRNNSKDSRFWENPYVPIDDIQAKAKCILFPLSDIGSLCYN